VAKPPRLLCLYIDALVKSCHHNAAVLMGFFEVAHLVRPPTHLFHPRMLAAVSWGWRCGYGGCGCGYGGPAMAESGHVLGAANGRQLQAPARHVPALSPTVFLLASLSRPLTRRASSRCCGMLGRGSGPQPLPGQRSRQSEQTETASPPLACVEPPAT
jgi:hypothetical protein